MTSRPPARWRRLLSAPDNPAPPTGRTHRAPHPDTDQDGRRMTTHGTTTRGRGRRAAAPATVADERIRQERAYQLRLAGLSFEDIARSRHPDDPSRSLYADRGAARRAWQAAVERHSTSEATVEARELWTLRNERVFRALWPQVLRADHWAIDRYTRLFAEHARMLGLMVQRVEVAAGEADLDAALRDLSEQMRRRAELRTAGRLVPDE